MSFLLRFWNVNFLSFFNSLENHKGSKIEVRFPKIFALMVKQDLQKALFGCTICTDLQQIRRFWRKFVKLPYYECRLYISWWGMEKVNFSMYKLKQVNWFRILRVKETPGNGEKESTRLSGIWKNPGKKARFLTHQFSILYF